MRFPKGIREVEYCGSHITVTNRDGSKTERALCLTFRDVKAVTDRLRYESGHRRYDLQVEMAKLPPIVGSFHAYIAEHGHVPRDYELVTQYLGDWFYKDEGGFRLRAHPCKLFSKTGLAARVMRAYPSLMREFGFFLQVRDSHLFDEVRYSLKADYRDGIDLVVVKGGKQYGVALYCGTARSRSWKDHKNLLHSYAAMPQIDVVLDAKRVHGFAYYDEGDVRRVASRIAAMERAS